MFFSFQQWELLVNTKDLQALNLSGSYDFDQRTACGAPVGWSKYSTKIIVVKIKNLEKAFQSWNLFKTCPVIFQTAMSTDEIKKIGKANLNSDGTTQIRFKVNQRSECAGSNCFFKYSLK